MEIRVVTSYPVLLMENVCVCVCACVCVAVGGRGNHLSRHCGDFPALQASTHFADQSVDVRGLGRGHPRATQRGRGRDDGHKE